MRKIILLTLLFLTSCTGTAVTPIPTSTPNAGEIALQMMQSQMEANATSQAVGLQFTATAQVIGATATANQVIVEAQQTAQARRDEVATADQARIYAEATAEQKRIEIVATQQRLDLESTQSANATATFVVLTLSAVPTSAALTQIANEQNIALSNNEIQQSDLAVEQQRQKNTVEWAVPFIIAFMAALVGSLFVIRYSRTREIRDEDGGVQGLVLDNKNVISPKLLAGPVLDVESMTMPQLVSGAEQHEVTKRAQTIEALKVIPVEPSRNALSLFGDVFGTKRQEDAFEIIEGETLPPAGLLDGEALKSLDKDWKEANRE
jgi:hypothetical protein